MKSEIIDAFSQMAKLKNIDREILEGVIKESFNKMMEKKYGAEANFEVIVNMDKGNIDIYLNKEIVENVEDSSKQIDLETAQALSGEEFEIGDEYTEVLQIEDFGRRSVLNLKQNLAQKLREIEKEVTFNEYKKIVGEIIVCEVYQIKPNSILMMHNGHEIIFPKSEQIPKEKYKKEDTVRAIVKSVEKRQSGPPLIIVSRADEEFLEKLFELEIPEIYDGIINIVAIAREPGERAKVAVESSDERIDAVGACVGMKGIRIHSIVRELSNENIDVINYTDDPALFIARALSPARINDIDLDKDEKVAKIYADKDQFSLIIGRGGQNIKLASKLTGYTLDVIKPEEEEEEYEEEDDLEGYGEEEDEDDDLEGYGEEEEEEEGEESDDSEDNEEDEDSEEEDSEDNEKSGESESEESESDDDSEEEESETESTDESDKKKKSKK